MIVRPTNRPYEGYVIYDKFSEISDEAQRPLFQVVREHAVQIIHI